MEPVTAKLSARTILNVTTGVTGMKKEESTGRHIQFSIFVIKRYVSRGKCQLHFNCDKTTDHECRDCFMRPGHRCDCMYGTPMPDLGK